MDLVEHALDRRPLVADVRGPLLHLLARGERRQAAADPVERALRPRGLGPVGAAGSRLGAAAATPASRRSSALIRSHWRLTSLAVRASASPNTWGWRRTIFAASVALTSVRSKTPASAASWAWRMTWRSRSPSSSASAGVAPAAERVVDLVRLLEEVAPERLVGLLAVPRAAVRQPQPVRDPGHRPRARDGRVAGDRPQVERRGRASSAVSSPIVSASARSEPPDRMVGRIEPAEDGDRVVAARSVAARQDRRQVGGRGGRGRHRGVIQAEDRRRDDQRRTGRLERRRGRASRSRGPEGRRRGRAPSGAAPRRRARPAPRRPPTSSRLAAGIEVARDRHRVLLLGVPVLEGVGLDRGELVRVRARPSAPR